MPLHAPPCWLDVEEIQGAVIVRLTPRAFSDEETGQRLKTYLLGLVDRGGRLRLVLDFGLVEYVDSMGASKLVLLHQRLQALGGRLALCRISPRLGELFELLRLSLLFAIYPDQEAALEALDRPAPERPIRTRQVRELQPAS